MLATSRDITGKIKIIFKKILKSSKIIKTKRRRSLKFLVILSYSSWKVE